MRYKYILLSCAKVSLFLYKTHYSLVPYPNILFVAATNRELQPFKEGFPQFSCTFLLHEIGLLSACFHLTRALSGKVYDYVIQVGIAGSFNTLTYPVGACVIVGEEVLGRWGVREQDSFQDIFTMGLMDKNAFPFKNGGLVNPNPHLTRFNIPIVRSASVCEITTKEEIIAYYRNHQIDIENMEGAALHYVCLQYGVPFLQCRSVSNAVGDRNKRNWCVEEGLAQLLIILQQKIGEIFLI